MVVGVWELVKFLWSHPIISCLVLLLFSPPFFPIIVYFAPVLLCTGLVALAMVSMSMGESAQSEDWRNGTGRLYEAEVRMYEPEVQPHVEVPVKLAGESWLGWMKKKEQKAKEWVDSRFLSQEKWQFRNRPVLVPEEEADLVGNESDVGYRIPSCKAPTPIITKRAQISPVEANRDVLPPLAEAAEISNDRAYFSVPAAENTNGSPRAQVDVGHRLLETFSLKDQLPATLEVSLAEIMEEEVLKSKRVVPSPLKEFFSPVVAKVKKVSKSLLQEQPVSKFKSESHALDEGAIEVPLISSRKDVAHLGGNNCTLTEPIASEESIAFVLDSDQVTQVEELIVGYEKVTDDLGISVSSLETVQKVVEEESSNFQTSAHLPRSRHAAVEVQGSPAFRVLGEDKKATPEAEGEFRVIQPTQRLISTEKIIFVDEPARVQSRSMVAEAEGQMEALPIQKASGQVIVVEKTGLTEEDSKSPNDGLDENIEWHENPETMAVVKSQSILEEEFLQGRGKALVTSSPHDPTDLDLLAEQMEPMMALISSDSTAHLTSFGSKVLGKSYSLNSAFTTEREEHDDLTIRFNALKKSMSLHTSRRWEEPTVPVSLRAGTEATENAVVPFYVPDLVSLVQKENQFLGSSLVSPENPLTPPRLSSEDIESLESLTARLQKKFTLNVGINVPITSPPSRPAPVLPSIAASVESSKSIAAASVDSGKIVAAVESVDSGTGVAAVESEESVEVTGGLVPPVDAVAVKSKLKNSPSKKSLNSFLSRRRGQLVDPFSISGEGARGSKISSDTTTDTLRSAEVVSENRDEGSTTSGRHLKERMISPLKRVFSMDANADSRGNRKVEVGTVSSANASPAKEKHSVVDRSKVRLLKLFSNEGGLTKVELAGSLGKSKSVSKKAGDQSVQMTEGHDGEVENVMSLPSLIPPEVGHGVENVDVDVKSESQEELPSIEAGAPPTETVEELESISESMPSVPKEETVLTLTLLATEPDVSATGKGGKSTKSSSDKKFVWSWRNSHKSVARKTEAQDVELGSEVSGVEVSPTPKLAPSSIPTEVVRGIVGNVDVESEKHALSTAEVLHGSIRNVDFESEKRELHSTEAAVVILQNAEDEKAVEPIPSCPTLAPSTLGKKEPQDCSKCRGSEVLKSSNEKKFGWTWKKRKQLSEQLDDAPPAINQIPSQDDDEVFEIENVEVKSEKHELPSIDEAGAPLAETAEALDGTLESIPESLPKERTEPLTLDITESEGSATPKQGSATKPSSEKKFEWSWTKKKRSSEPGVDQFRSQDGNGIPTSRTGMLDESREIIMSPLSRFHSSSAIMSPVRQHPHVNVPVSWDENLFSEFRFSPRPDSNSSHHDSPKANSSPHKKSSTSWWSPKTDLSKIDHPVLEKVAPAEKKKVSSSWWPRKHKRPDSKEVSSSSSPADRPPTEISSASENDSITPCSGPLSPSSTRRTRDNSNGSFDHSLVENSIGVRNDTILEGDEEVALEVTPRPPRHRRERSDSLPASISGANKFSFLHERHTSLSEITLPLTPELSPGSSGGMISSTSFSMPRTEDDRAREHVKRIGSDGSRARSMRTTSFSATSLPSYQISRSSVRMLDLANEQLKGGSPLHRSDLDAGSRGLYRSPPPSAAEIRITDKLKAPLDEILSLLAIGDNDDQSHLTSGDSNCTGGAIAGGDGLRQAASSSSSSEGEATSDEEWSVKSDNEDESQEQEQQQQFTLLPPSGRIRRMLPHYVFSREEPTAT